MLDDGMEICRVGWAHYLGGFKGFKGGELDWDRGHECTVRVRVRSDCGVVAGGPGWGGGWL